MIKVWLIKTVRHGEDKPDLSSPPLEVSLERAIEIFHLAGGRWMSPLGSPPRIQDDSVLPTTFYGYRFVVLEIPEGVPGWRKGFYLIHESVLTPTEAIELMKQEGWQQDK